jgi:hypothetical protein
MSDYDRSRQNREHQREYNEKYRNQNTYNYSRNTNMLNRTRDYRINGNEFMDILANNCIIEHEGKEYVKYTNLATNMVTIKANEYNRLSKSFFELRKIKEEQIELENKKKKEEEEREKERKRKEKEDKETARTLMLQEQFSKSISEASNFLAKSIQKEEKLKRNNSMEINNSNNFNNTSENLQLLNEIRKLREEIVNIKQEQTNMNNIQNSANYKLVPQSTPWRPLATGTQVYINRQNSGDELNNWEPPEYRTTQIEKEQEKRRNPLINLLDSETDTKEFSKLKNKDTKNTVIGKRKRRKPKSIYASSSSSNAEEFKQNTTMGEKKAVSPSDEEIPLQNTNRKKKNERKFWYEMTTKENWIEHFGYELKNRRSHFKIAAGLQAYLKDPRINIDWTIPTEWSKKKMIEEVSGKIADKLSILPFRIDIDEIMD